MTKQDIIKKAYSFRCANREFSQEMEPLVEGIVEQIAALEVDDVEALTDAQLDALNVGDKVAKKTGTAEHFYVVSYKDAENGGLCLTYTDASVVETVSYDHTADGWAYNSKDVTPIIEHVSVSDQRAQLEVLCKALEDAGVVTSYTISETATDKIFDISFNE